MSGECAVFGGKQACTSSLDMAHKLVILIPPPLGRNTVDLLCCLCANVIWRTYHVRSTVFVVAQCSFSFYDPIISGNHYPLHGSPLAHHPGRHLRQSSRRSRSVRSTLVIGRCNRRHSSLVTMVTWRARSRYLIDVYDPLYVRLLSPF